MEHYGLLSLLPPIIAIALAFATKEVFTSLAVLSPFLPAHPGGRWPL